MKKEMYLSPRTDVLSLGYAEPLCVTVSGTDSNGISDYTPIDFDPSQWL